MKGRKAVCSEGRCSYSWLTGPGNYICEAGENKCTAPLDCGPCKGSTRYLNFGCDGSECLAKIKPDVLIEPKSIFDDRKIGPFHLQNYFRYNSPFNVKEDKLEIEFNLYEVREDVSNVIIETIRVFERQEEVASAEPKALLPRAGYKAKVEIEIPPQPLPEFERSLIVTVWYSYLDQKGKQTGSFTKSLEKLTLLTP